MKKIIVTGGCGFIGSHLVDALVKKNYKVIVIDNLFTGRKEYRNPKAKYHWADVLDLPKLKQLFKGVDFVFHTAALARIQPSIKNPLDVFKVNALGTLNVLLAARDAKIKKVIYSASSSGYGDQPSLPLREDMTMRPKSMYALSKFTGEEMCRIFSKLYGLKTVSLRYFNVYGPRQIKSGAYATVVGIFLDQLSKGKALTIVGDGSIERDLTYIDDVVDANLLAMRSPRATEGEVFNIGFGKCYSINEVAAMMLGIPAKKLPQARKEGAIIHLPSRPAESKATLANISKAKKLLDWRPKINFKTGLALIKKYY